MTAKNICNCNSVGANANNVYQTWEAGLLLVYDRTHHAYIWFYIVHVQIYRRRSYAEFLSAKRTGQTCICRKPLLIAGNAKAASSTFHTAKAGSIFRRPKWVLTRLDWLFAVSRTQTSCSCCPPNQRHPSSCRCNLFTAARVPHAHTLQIISLHSNYLLLLS
jgi:hypothetical protein